MVGLLYNVLFTLLEEVPIVAVFLPSRWVVEENELPPSVEIYHGNYVGKVGSNWLSKQTPTKIKKALSHLAAHLICNHPQRTLYTYKDDIWKVACDYEANHILIQLDKRRFGSLLPRRKKWFGKSAEEIYFLLDKDGDEKFGFDDSHGWFSAVDSGDLPTIVKQSFGFHYSDSLSEISQVLNRISSLIEGRLNPMELVSQVFSEKGAGLEPEGMVSFVSEVGISFVPHTLFRYLSAEITRKRGYLPPEIDFLFLWQKRVAEISLPFSPRLLLVCVDTSASISDKMLPAIASFVVSFYLFISKLYPNCEVVVMMADAAPQSFWSSAEPSELLVDFIARMRGRGGTKIFTSIEKFVEEHGKIPDAIVIVSDFETADNESVLKAADGVPIFGILVNEDTPVDFRHIIETTKKRFSKVKFIGGITG